METKNEIVAKSTWGKWFREFGYDSRFLSILKNYYVQDNKLRHLVDDKEWPHQTFDNYFVNLTLIKEDTQ